jgi:hypothetical protein
VCFDLIYIGAARAGFSLGGWIKKEKVQDRFFMSCTSKKENPKIALFPGS